MNLMRISNVQDYYVRTVIYSKVCIFVENIPLGLYLASGASGRCWRCLFWGCVKSSPYLVPARSNSASLP